MTHEVNDMVTAETFQTMFIACHKFISHCFLCQVYQSDSYVREALLSDLVCFVA